MDDWSGFRGRMKMVVIIDFYAKIYQSMVDFCAKKFTSIIDFFTF